MISTTILRLRQERGWSQQDLARRLGVAKSTVLKWETGAVEPRLRQLRELSSVFGVTIDNLAGEGAIIHSERPHATAFLDMAQEAATATIALVGAVLSAEQANLRTLRDLDELENAGSKAWNGLGDLGDNAG